jgi:hypothetical protein
MTDEPRNPDLQRWFANADVQLAGDEFVEAVLVRTERARRRVIATRIGIGLGLALAALPFQDVMFTLAEIPLVVVGDGWAVELVAPFNSVASVVSLAAIGLRMVYRKVFGRL